MGSFRGKLARFTLITVMFLLAFGGFSNATVHAQQATAPAPNPNWPASSYDFQNTNNDPQTVININNVLSLQLRWIYQIPVNPFSIPGAPPALGIEAQPIIDDGIIYLATPYNDIIALNAETGTTVWSYPGQHDQVHRGEVVVRGLRDKRHLSLQPDPVRDGF